jgi:hypothetical protein
MDYLRSLRSGSMHLPEAANEYRRRTVSCGEPWKDLSGRRAALEPSSTSTSEEAGLPRTIVEEDYSTRGSVENLLNQQRLLEFREFTSHVLQLIEESSFEYGFDNEFDVFLRDRLAKNALATKQWMNEVFIENFGDSGVLVGILRALAHVDYQVVRPQGPTMAIAAFSHTDAEVRECGIRAMENWGTSECLAALESISCPEAWLQEYVTQVISDLRERLSDAGPREKD